MLHIFLNSRYLFQGLTISYVTRRCYVNRKNIEFINIRNNPLNPELHILRATFTGKPDMKSFSTPLPKGEIFEDNIFYTPY